MHFAGRFKYMVPCTVSYAAFQETVSPPPSPAPKFQNLGDGKKCRAHPLQTLDQVSAAGVSQYITFSSLWNNKGL